MLTCWRACGRGWLHKRGLLSPEVGRSISASTIHRKPQFPPRTPVDESAIVEKFLKGTGPGGQKINKTNSAVQLQHLPTGIVVKCQETRSREQNRKLARRKLMEKLEELELGDNARTAIKTKIKQKKSASKRKKSQRKYRALEEEKKIQGQTGFSDVDGNEDDEEKGDDDKDEADDDEDSDDSSNNGPVQNGEGEGSRKETEDESQKV